jgi:cyclic beta-1,2-glucan synthetase
LWNRFAFKRKIPESDLCKRQIDADPIRDELYSRDHLAQHARETACSYRVDTRKGRDRLLPRLADNEKVLLETHDLMKAAIEANRGIAPAGEWLLDNFYLH